MPKCIRKDSHLLRDCVFETETGNERFPTMAELVDEHVVLNSDGSVKSAPTPKLPIETELVDRSWYLLAGVTYAVYLAPSFYRGTTGEIVNPGAVTIERLAPVVRYEPPKPEVAEPTGLGAVIRSFTLLTRCPTVGHMPWIDSVGNTYAWRDLAQPVEVLSEGVEL